VPGVDVADSSGHRRSFSGRGGGTRFGGRGGRGGQRNAARNSSFDGKNRFTAVDEDSVQSSGTPPKPSNPTPPKKFTLKTRQNEQRASVQPLRDSSSNAKDDDDTQPSSKLQRNLSKDGTEVSEESGKSNSSEELDGFILVALRNPKDRLFLLRLDKDLEAFINDAEYALILYIFPSNFLLWPV
jgi:hypothetical protein